MTDVGNQYFIRNYRVEDQVTQTLRHNNAYIRFIGCSSGEWMITDFPRSLHKTRDETGCDDRAILANVSVDLCKITLRGPCKANPHTRRCS